VFWIVVTILLALAAIGLVIFGRRTSGGVDLRVMGPVVAGVAWVVLSFFFMVHTVGQRQVGIVYGASGTISGKKDAGWVLTAPWQHIKRENVGIQSEEFVLDTNNAAVSQDQQPIYARLFINFQVEPQNVVKLYKTVGPSWKQILLEARVLQDFKEITATYQTPLITTHRDQLRQETKRRLTNELAKYDVKIVDVFLKNIGFSDSYTRAVEAKQVQVQQALQAQAKVAQSTAEAAQAIAKAKGEATAIALEGRALRNNPQVLTLRSIAALNPKAQVIFCSSGSCPSFLPQALTGGK
jgi:regulator of protease activity HflC (stomatin/prohibitin superfamily)